MAPKLCVFEKQDLVLLEGLCHCWWSSCRVQIQQLISGANPSLEVYDGFSWHMRPQIRTGASSVAKLATILQDKGPPKGLLANLLVKKKATSNHKKAIYQVYIYIIVAPVSAGTLDSVQAELWSQSEPEMVLNCGPGPDSDIYLL